MMSSKHVMTKKRLIVKINRKILNSLQYSKDSQIIVINTEFYSYSYSLLSINIPLFFVHNVVVSLGMVYN